MTTIGSITSGTMRNEDLIPTFLEYVQDEELKDAIEDRIEFSEQDDNSYDYYNCEDSDYDMDSLFNALQEIAGPYFYFGSHPGDGSDYGFWLCEDVAEMVKDSGGYVVSDVAEISVDKIREDGWPESGHVDVLHVNDHGNVTLYDYACKTNVFTEIWAIV